MASQFSRGELSTNLPGPHSNGWLICFPLLPVASEKTLIGSHPKCSFSCDRSR